jgi:Na+/glutamate symporter
MMRTTRWIGVPALTFGLLLGACGGEPVEENGIPEAGVAEEDLTNTDVDLEDIEVTVDTQRVPELGI